MTNTSHCVACGKLLSGLRGSALTCSSACRKRKSRTAKKLASVAVERFESFVEECIADAQIAQQKRNGEVGPNV